MTHTLIPGKDAALEDTVRTLQDKLAARGFHVDERSWLNPVEGVWSVHIAERDCPQLFSNGKGACRLSALASALGEFFERLTTRYFWNHYYLGEHLAAADHVHQPNERWFPVPADGHWPAGLLTPDLCAFYNPDGAVPASALVDFNSGNAQRGICALPFVRQRDGIEVWFPVNILANLYVSNGMAAGNTVPEARAQALSEICERHVKFRVIGEALCLPDLPDEVIARHPVSAAGIAALRAAGYGIVVKDASLGGNFPVINVTLLNPRDQGCFASFGAHPRLGIALERALTELLQGRALDALDGFPPPTTDRDAVASAQNLESHFVDSDGLLHWNFFANQPDFNFVDWDAHTRTTAADKDWLVARLHAEGHDVYVADTATDGVYACRIIVPGVSEIYGVDELEWENNSAANDLRAAILRLPELDDDACGDLLDTLNERGFADERPVAALIGLAPDPGSLWEDLRVGELKLLLALACGDPEATAEGCDWAVRFGQIGATRLGVYRCLATLLELDDPAPFRAALDKLFGQATVNTALALLAGERAFFAFAAPGTGLAGCERHARLLEALDKARR